MEVKDKNGFAIGTIDVVPIKKTFVVTKSMGEYSDRTEEPVKVFSSMKKAENYVKAEEIKEKGRLNIDKELVKEGLLEHSSSLYDSTYWKIYTVEVNEKIFKLEEEE